MTTILFNTENNSVTVVREQVTHWESAPTPEGKTKAYSYIYFIGGSKVLVQCAAGDVHQKLNPVNRR